MFERGLNKSFRAGFSIFFEQIFSSEPALTPIRIEHPWSRAACKTSRTREALPILPGLIRRQAAPASAFHGPAVMKMYIGNNRHRALGTNDFQCSRAVLIWARHPHNIRPAAAAPLICAIVASTSLVRLLVMVCTGIGVATNRHIADHYLATPTSFNRAIRPIGV